MGNWTRSNKAVQVESKNDVEDRFRQVAEKWEDRLTLDNLRLVERYVDQELHILLEFRLRDGEEFITCLQRATPGLIDEMPTHVGNRQSWMAASEKFLHFLSLRWREAMGYVCRTGSKQQAMFVEIVEFMESPEHRTFPTFVWLDRVDCINRLLPRALYFSTADGRYVFCCIIRDWKRGLGSNGVPFFVNEVTDQMVEGTSQVLQNVSGYQTNFHGHIRKVGDIVRALQSVRIVLASDSIWIGTREGIVEENFQIVDLAYGPFGFGS